eukprot:5398769-Pyramimonas_sp.AAC.1
MFLFPLPQPLLPLRGRVCPSPHPLPWACAGVPARGWSAQGAQRWLQEGSYMASKMAQDSA